MPLSLPEFLCQMTASPALTLTVLLTLAVLLVNGWTDAPNAIAAAVVTGALPFRPAVGLAALCNLLGVLCVTAVNTSVAETIYSIASFGGGPRAGLASDLGGGGCLLLATLLGLPVSTTHTRTAALLGAGSTSGRRIDWSVARSIALTWVLTFPGCFTLGWCMARLFLAWV